MNIKEALEIAVEDEAKAIKFYKELVGQAEDPETRVMLEQIAREEEGHWRRLSERLKAIKLLG